MADREPSVFFDYSGGGGMPEGIEFTRQVCSLIEENPRLFACWHEPQNERFTLSTDTRQFNRIAPCHVHNILRQAMNTSAFIPRLALSTPSPFILERHRA